MPPQCPRISVSVLGEIDIASAPLLERALRDLAADGCRLLEVDLDHVDFMDSSVVGLLLRTRAYLERGQACLRVRCSRPVHRRIFRLTSTDQRLNVTAAEPVAGAAPQDAGHRRYVVDCRTPPATLSRPHAARRSAQGPWSRRSSAAAVRGPVI
ncbi:STAS domain-containing protein [Streptomyces sp. NPDC002513]